MISHVSQIASPPNIPPTKVDIYDCPEMEVAGRRGGLMEVGYYQPLHLVRVRMMGILGGTSGTQWHVKSDETFSLDMFEKHIRTRINLDVEDGTIRLAQTLYPKN